MTLRNLSINPLVPLQCQVLSSQHSWNENPAKCNGWFCCNVKWTGLQQPCQQYWKFAGDQWGLGSNIAMYVCLMLLNAAKTWTGLRQHWYWAFNPTGNTNFTLTYQGYVKALLNAAQCNRGCDLTILSWLVNATISNNFRHLAHFVVLGRDRVKQNWDPNCKKYLLWVHHIGPHYSLYL